jgi:DNA-binding transcriptional MerR regulator
MNSAAADALGRYGPAGGQPSDGRMTAADGRAPTGLVSIGEVLALLREEFPDVTMSKLRFLEAEGLVEPRRTPAGYRKYSNGDVERLRYVLSAQRDRFLPLRVIRDQLAAIDRGEPDATLTPPAANSSASTAASEIASVTGENCAATESVGTDPATARHAAVGNPSGPPGARARYSRREVLERSQLTDHMLTELEDAGLLGARTSGWYDGDALTVATVAGALAAYGLAPRHLRAYRAGADREVGVFAQLLAPLRRSTTPAAQARAEQALEDLATLSQQLHGALVRVGLRDALGR